MNETYKKLIFIILSIGVLAGAIFGIVRPRNEKTNAVMGEVNTLQSRYDDLLSKEVNRQQYLDDTEAYKDMYNARLDEFPSNWDQEYQIEFIEGVRKNENITYDVSSLGMQAASRMYSLGGSNSEGMLATTGDEDTSTGYECYKGAMTLAYSGSYEGIKDFMDYVSSFPYRMTVDSVSIAKGNSEEDVSYSGQMQMSIYYVTGNGRDVQFDIDLDDVDTGVDNLFEGGAGAADISKYAADNGEAIATDYDLYVTVNPADSDTSGKIVGLRSGGDTITSSKNEGESVSIKITQDGSSYTAEYGIGTEKTLQEFDPGDDLTLYIQSSEIKDASDLNSVSLSITNTSDKTLYVKVAGDETAFRVKIANRSGAVVVYR